MSSAARTEPRRRPQKLVRRLTRAYVGLFAGLLVLLSALIFTVAFSHLTETHAKNLEGTAMLIADHLADEYNEGLDLSRKDLLSDLNTDYDLNLVIKDASGKTVNYLRNYYFDENQLKDANEKIRLKLSNGMLLMYAQYSINLFDSYPATLLLVLNLQTELDFMTLIAVLLLCADAAGIVAAAFLGARVTRRMLSPVEEMISAAAEIDSANLKTRLKIPERDDELRSLALTVNSMLDRVESAFTQQSRFAADASHELRTPLSVMQGYIDLMIRWGGTDPEVRAEAISALDQQIRYMNRLVSNLLLLERLESGQKEIVRESFDVPALFKELTAEQAIVDTAHVYQLNCPDSCGLFADRSMVRQLLRILLDNAMKYTPKGGIITLSCSEAPAKVTLSVSDTGIGMNPLDRAHAFERFYRADTARSRSTGGMGLGLSIARSIAKANGGSIAAKAAAEGPGTAIEAVFPKTAPN